MNRWWFVITTLGVLRPVRACGGIFLDEKGIIASPNNTEGFPHNRECVYSIMASEDARIKLSCSKINLRLSEGCQKESLSINGIYKCGNTKLDDVYGQGVITLRLTQNGTANRKRVFRCTYERVSGGMYDATKAKIRQENECISTPEPTQPKPTNPPLASSSTSSCASGEAEYNYDEVIRKSLLFYEAQRSGFLPPSQQVTWRQDSATNDALDAETNQRVDLEGGYYDAGDYVKFGYPMAATATVLAWGAVEYAEAYKAAGEMTNMRAAVKWATDYFMKAHVAPNVFYGQVGNGDADHAYWGRPEDMTMARPAFKITESKPGSDLAGETAAALAAASILFKASNTAYSNECLDHARQLYDFANSFRGKYSDSINEASKFYKSWGAYDDELAWASLWLYRATGERSYLTQAKSHYSSIHIDGVEEFSWAEKSPGAMVLMVQLAEESEKSLYAKHLENFCDRMIDEKPKTPKGLLYLSKWGSLRYAANVAFVCLRAADLGIKSEIYREFSKQQIHYMLGSSGRSFVVGFGNSSPERPHHRSSSCKDPPQPCTWSDYNSPNPNPQILQGALVGGPDASDNYVDRRDDYIANEVACDYNAGFQSAVAALRQLSGCGGESTGSSAPATTQPSFTTSAPKVTTDERDPVTCARIQQTNEWSGNIQANLILQIPFNCKSWSITLTFTSAVTRFQVWVADSTSTSSNTITLTNKSYNGYQTEGNTLTINFIASYSGDKPHVTSITFNDTPLCLD